MSQENVEVVRRMYEAVAAGDSEAVLAKYDPGVEFDFSRSPFATLLNKTSSTGMRGFGTSSASGTRDSTRPRTTAKS